MTNEEFIKSISLEREEWRDVVGYEGRYIVSSLGRIVALAHDHITHPYGKEHILHRDAHLLTPTPFKSTKYFYIMFRKEGVRHKCSVHRLVAQAFIPNPHNLPQVDHIDGNRQNNNINNLRWCDAVGNMANPITQKRVEEGRDSIKFYYRIPVVQLEGNRKIAVYPSCYETRKYGYNPSSVNRCVNGTRLTYLGYRWISLSDYETLINKSKNSQYHD